MQHWIWGSHDQGKDSTMGHRGDPVPELSLGEVAEAIIGTDSSNISEAVQISDAGGSTTALYVLKVYMDPTCPAE